MRKWITVAAPLLALAPLAQAYTIDFGESGSPVICSNTANGLGTLIGCSDGTYLSQTFGDVAGVSDITYAAPRIGATQSLRWWSSSYNNLYGVAWADGGDANSRAQIVIQALQPGSVVTLSSFDLGAYSNTTRNTMVTVSTLGGSTLFSYNGLVGDGSVASTPFAPGVSALGGLVITWQDSAYNVGIDHISYSVSAVPEPAALALMLAGLGVVGLRARRRG